MGGEGGGRSIILPKLTLSKCGGFRTAVKQAFCNIASILGANKCACVAIEARGVNEVRSGVVRRALLGGDEVGRSHGVVSKWRN